MDNNFNEVLNNNPSNDKNLTGNGITENIDSLNEEIKIPIVEEQVIVSKQLIEKASVRILKEVSQSEELVQTGGFDETVTVVSVPRNIYVDNAPPPVRYEGNTLIIPVLREEMVVVKRLLLVEELHVTKTCTQTTDEQVVTLRKESIKVIRKEYNT
jgi:stress response protein YsnF